MENEKDRPEGKVKDTEFKAFAFTRIILGLVVAGSLLYGLFAFYHYATRDSGIDTASLELDEPFRPEVRPAQAGGDDHETRGSGMVPGDDESGHLPKTARKTEDAAHGSQALPQTDTEHQTEKAPAAETGHKKSESAAKHEDEAAGGHATEGHQVLEGANPDIKGTSFITAAMYPIDYELNHRFYGWRPNDIVNFTDNVNMMQLAILEVTRRTAVILAERLSRTGSVEAFDENLERAMNWFMVKADLYWFPSPESKYNQGLEEWTEYRERLMRREAKFFTRADNLIPLLLTYEDLLGSCDENLVKEYEEDGSPVSWFKVDNYFYYAKGVARALEVILEAVAVDFKEALETRHGMEVLHHAIHSCKRAAALRPWIVTDGPYDGFLANHRANMAAPISHARFYLGVLIKTLST